MIVDQRPRGKYIAHYTTLSRALEHILPTGMMRLGSLGSVNDPRENKRRRFTGSWSGQVDEQIARDLIWQINELDTIDGLMRRFVKVGCFTQNSNHDTSQVVPAYSRPRMWAQYADNHRGVCLLFDREEFSRILRGSVGAAVTTHAASVHYTAYGLGLGNLVDPSLMFDPFTVSVDEVAKKGLVDYVGERLKVFWFEYFFVKLHDWRDESEFRFVVLTDDEAPHFVRFQTALKAIVIGVDCSEAYEPSLCALSEEFKVPCGRIKWRNGIPINPS